MSLNYSQRTRSLVEVGPATRQGVEPLTYEPFFGLSEKPFSLVADSRFVYDSPSYLATRERLIAGIRRREGLLVLTGQIGTGKTTLCRTVLADLGRNTYSSLVPDPFASREDLLKMMLIDFGVLSVQDLTTGSLRQASRTELGYLLAEFLESLTRDAFVVVVIDEAQNLSLPLIEETRILSDTFGAKGRMQIVFVGQPELHARLKSPEMRQVDQRVCGYHRLEPLSREALGGYIQHRLQAAGFRSGRELFGSEVLDTLHARTGGVPRLINRVCDRALALAHAHRADAVSRDVLDAALIEVGAATLSPTWDSIVFSTPPATPTGAPSAAAPTTAAPAAGPAADLAEFASEPDPARSEQDHFKKEIEQWVASELALPARTLTPARRAPGTPDARTSKDIRPVPPPSQRRAIQASEMRSETYVRRLARMWVKWLAIGGGVMVALNLVLAAASWALTMMEPPAAPPTPERPVAVVAGLPALDVPSGGIAIEEATLPASANYLVAVGLFYDGQRADRLVDMLSQAGLPAMQRPITLRGRQMQQIVLGPYLTRAEAATELRRLQTLGGYDDADVIDDTRQP